MVFAEQWKAAKKQFEDATGKKKPSQKFLGVIRQGAGLESATKSMDGALQKGDPDAIAKAEADFGKASDGYAAILKKAAGEEKGVTYKDEVARLEKALDAIFTAWIKAKGEAIKGRFDREADGVKTKIVAGAASAKAALGPARAEYNNAEAIYTSMHKLLDTIVTKKQEGDAPAVKAAADQAAKSLKEIEAIVPRLAASHQKLLAEKRANRALFESFKAKYKAPPVDAGYFDASYDPFVDQVDVNKVLTNLVFALGARVKTLHDQAYARVAAIDKFTTYLGDYDNADSQADPVKREAMFKALKKDINDRAFPREAADIKKVLVSTLSTCYAEMGGLVLKTKNVPGLDSQINDIRSMLDAMEKWSGDVDKSVEKILKLQARIPF